MSVCIKDLIKNLNLRGGFKKTIMDYIAEKHPDLVPLYEEIYNKKNRSYFEALEQKAERLPRSTDAGLWTMRLLMREFHRGTLPS